MPLGMVSGRIKEIKPVRQIVDDIIAEADVVVNKLWGSQILEGVKGNEE